MIIKINDAEYSGKIDSLDNDYLSVLFFSDKEFNYLGELIGKTKKIEIIDDGAVVGEYDILNPVALNKVANGVYVGKFALRDKTVEELKNTVAEMSKTIDELNGTIDSMLVAILEG